MLRQARNQSVNSQSQSNLQEDDFDIELLIDLVRQFPVIWNTKLNVFKDFNKKKNAWKSICNSLDNKYSGNFFQLKNICSLFLF